MLSCVVLGKETPSHEALEKLQKTLYASQKDNRKSRMDKMNDEKFQTIFNLKNITK